MSEKEHSILFITDIHQNINGVKKIDFSKYNEVICAGDILDSNNPDITIAKKIIDLFPSNTIIIPGNCDKDNVLIEYMKKKLNFIHKSFTFLNNIPILGIGYSRNLKNDMKIYREYFLKDHKRIFAFFKKNHLSFLLDFCGIKINKNNEINIISFEEACESSKDFINKFQSIDEKEIDTLFSSIDSLENGILLTHSPPYGALDKLDGLPHIGSESIAAGIKKTKPLFILCGHFHELYAKSTIYDTPIFNPGSVKDNRYGVITISKNIDFKFKKL